jgi:predicted nucleic acid-binding protein
VYEFLNIVTHPRIYQPPTPLGDPLSEVERWLESPRLVLLAEPPGFFAVVRSVVARAGVVGPAVHDARIGALCVHYGVAALYTADRDFSRFSPLRTHNPLVGG